MSQTKTGAKLQVKAGKEPAALDPRTFAGPSLEDRRKGFLWLKSFRHSPFSARSMRDAARSSRAAKRKSTKTVASAG